MATNFGIVLHRIELLEGNWRAPFQISYPSSEILENTFDSRRNSSGNSTMYFQDIIDQLELVWIDQRGPVRRRN